VALALYRKYRSATFSEVIGQEHVTAPLMQALSSGKINHAYLFSGPRGCGKTSSARILARSLNCIQGPTPTPCGVCDSCKDLAPNGSGSIDVIEIDAASHGGVDDARDLRERAYYAPARDRYKVYIIDEAHMVTTQGFNALLKLVEEPPDFLIFIFATTEPDKVLQTIRSRTHHYPFRLIPPTALRTHLERISEAEGAIVEAAVFPLVVRSGGGSARDSLSILDQLLAGAGREGVTYQMAVGLLGVTDSALLDDMITALAVGDSAAVYSTIDRVVEAGHDPRRFAADLLERLRDLMVLDSVPDAVDKGLIDYPVDQADRMADQSRRIGTATLVRFADIAHTTLTDMRGTTSPRLMLELLSARMLLPDASADAAALLQRLERLERRQAMAPTGQGQLDEARTAAQSPAAEQSPARPMPARPAPVQPKATDAKAAEPAAAQPAAAEPAVDKPGVDQPEPGPALPEPAPAPPIVASAAPASSGPTDSTGLRNLWPEVLDAVLKRSKVKWAMMEGVIVASVEGSHVKLLAPAGLARRIADDSNLAVLREALSSVVAGDWQLEVSAAPATGGVAARDGAVPEPAADTAAKEANKRTAETAVERPARPARPARPQRPKVADEAPVTRSDDDGVDEESDAVSDAGPDGVDPEQAAMELLKNSLGARPMDG
jgi:DNA polymerase-3 subunit gamma/tau